MIWLLALCAHSIGQRLHQIGILKHIAATIGVPDQPLLDDTLAIELANTDQSLPHLVGEPCDNNTIYHRFAQDDLLLIGQRTGLGQKRLANLYYLAVSNINLRASAAQQSRPTSCNRPESSHR